MVAIVTGLAWLVVMSTGDALTMVTGKAVSAGRITWAPFAIATWMKHIRIMFSNFKEWVHQSIIFVNFLV